MHKCLKTNPVEPVAFRCDMFVFVHSQEEGNIHTDFIEALEGTRSFITQDDDLE